MSRFTGTESHVTVIANLHRLFFHRLLELRLVLIVCNRVEMTFVEYKLTRWSVV